MAKKAKRGFLAKLGARLSGKRNAPAFDTAGHGRQLRGFTPGISGPNINLVSGPAAMRDRSRDLTRKFPLLNGAYDQFINGAWAAGNDYRGAQGYVDGASVTVKTPELPEGFSFDAPEVEIEEQDSAPTLDDRIAALEEITLEMMLGGANV